VAVAVGLATPSLMRSKTAAAEPRAMTALLPTAPPSALQRASVAAPSAATTPTVEGVVTPDADAAPVKAPPKKKKAKAAAAADDVPY
jgi:hypothetical protein